MAHVGAAAVLYEGKAGMKQPGSGDALGALIDNSLQQLAKLVFLTFIIAWCLTRTPSRTTSPRLSP